MNTNFQTRFKIVISDWDWWDNHRLEVYAWMSRNTEYGTPGIMHNAIYFKTPAEMTWFKLKWGTEIEEYELRL